MAGLSATIGYWSFDPVFVVRLIIRVQRQSLKELTKVWQTMPVFVRSNVSSIATKSLESTETLYSLSFLVNQCF